MCIRDRDPLGYVDGMGLYAGYFVPGALDPSGSAVCGAPCPTEGAKEYGPTSTTKVEIHYRKGNPAASAALGVVWETLVAAAGSSLGPLGKLLDVAGKAEWWLFFGIRWRTFKARECRRNSAGTLCWNGWTQVDKEYAFGEIAELKGTNDIGVVFPGEGNEPNRERRLTEANIDWVKHSTFSMTPPCPAP